MCRPLAVSTKIVPYMHPQSLLVLSEFRPCCSTITFNDSLVLSQRLLISIVIVKYLCNTLLKQRKMCFETKKMVEKYSCLFGHHLHLRIIHSLLNLTKDII